MASRDDEEGTPALPCAYAALQQNSNSAGCVRSKHENALPVIITHGWPGSIVEQLKLIEPLTNPTAYGGTAADAFDVVIPNMRAMASLAGPPAPAGDRSESRVPGSC